MEILRVGIKCNFTQKTSPEYDARFLQVFKAFTDVL